MGEGGGKIVRRLIKKWGESLLAALCVLSILFAALYTRQDDLRRAAARNAAASQDERLADTPDEPRWTRPVTGDALTPFSGARRENGLWRFSPYVRYAAQTGESIRAMAAGTVTEAKGDTVRVAHADGAESEYRNLAHLRVKRGDAVAAGDALGTAGPDGWIEVSLLEDGAYTDPEKKITGP